MVRDRHNPVASFSCLSPFTPSTPPTMASYEEGSRKRDSPDETGGDEASPKTSRISGKKTRMLWYDVCSIDNGGHPIFHLLEHIDGGEFPEGAFYSTEEDGNPETLKFCDIVKGAKKMMRASKEKVAVVEGIRVTSLEDVLDASTVLAGYSVVM